MLSFIAFSALFLVCASAQTIGQVKSCFKDAREKCRPDCQKSSNVSQALVDKIHQCAHAEHNASFDAHKACVQAANITFNDSSPCWKPNFSGGNWTGPGRGEYPTDAVRPHKLLQAYHECIHKCVKYEDCFKGCTGTAPPKDTCHHTAQKTARPAFSACMKAAAGGG